MQREQLVLVIVDSINYQIWPTAKVMKNTCTDLSLFSEDLMPFYISIEKIIPLVKKIRILIIEITCEAQKVQAHGI